MKLFNSNPILSLNGKTWHRFDRWPCTFIVSLNNINSSLLQQDASAIWLVSIDTPHLKSCHLSGWTSQPVALSSCCTEWREQFFQRAMQPFSTLPSSYFSVFNNFKKKLRRPTSKVWCLCWITEQILRCVLFKLGEEWSHISFNKQCKTRTSKGLVQPACQPVSLTS